MYSKNDSKSDREKVIAVMKEAEAAALKKECEKRAPVNQGSDLYTPVSREPNRRIPVKKAKGGYIEGRSGKTYARAVVGKSTSELFRMGYTSAEVKDMRKRGGHPMSYRVKRRLKRFFVIALLAYLLVIGVASLKIDRIHENMRLMIAATGNSINFAKMSFFDHAKVYAVNPDRAWNCVWADEEFILLELAIDYGRMVGADTREMEMFRNMYGFLD